ncbi:TonB-dependent receptor [Microbulbifer halophilus]|uniref:TonB-dependent receptor n=1 Tax=Microbulbifer halophilus TaxID=453963 RepID=A0ABW5EKC1_9GAMM|nr:TonB-dependent receptor [Microbulbifer halophilus]MCW8127761.1 TonB-dependent receptor [Microbulbifer halophilus]
MIKLSQAIRLANQSLVSLGSLGALAVFSAGAVAQSSGESLEEVSVVGIRASLEQNIDMKRDADSVVDAITAEDIGKFPDKNVAEALQRVPGVSISRDFGEGEDVSIRGTDSSLNMTLLNGQTVATSQWKVLSALSRGFNYAMLPSDLISSAEVYKTPQADIDEGSVGGTIILRTRKPLELDSGTAGVSLESQYSDLPEQWDPSASAFASWKNEAGTFGVLGAVVSQDRTVERHGSEVFGPGSYTDSATGEGVVVPWALGSALFKQKRERRGVDLNLQYAPNEQFDATLHYLASEMGASNSNQNFLPIISNAIQEGAVATQTDEDGIVTSAEIDGGMVEQMHVAYDVIYRDGSSMDTDVLDLDLNYDLGFARLHGQVGRTTSEGRANDDFYEFVNRPNGDRVDWTYTNDGHPSSSFVDSGWITDPADELMLKGYFESRIAMYDEESYAQVDAEFDLESGPFNLLKVGYKHRDRDTGQDRVRTEAANLGDDEYFGSAGDFWSGALVSGLHGETGFGPSAYFDPDRDKLDEYFNGLPDCGADTTELCSRRDFTYYPSIFDINENVDALYVKADFDVEGIRGNVGVRYVTTDTTSGAWNFSDAQGAFVHEVIKSDYSDLLPSLNLAWDLNDDVVLRFAAAKVIARPSPSQLTSSVSTTPESSKGSGGNPYLDPYRASQFDFGAEWYFTEGALAAATLFNKRISNFIFTEIRPEVVAIPDGSIEINEMSRPQNGPSVDLNGVETQLQYSFDNGFGFVGNYTYTDVGDAETASGPVTLPGNSEHMANLSGFYESEMFSARLAYNYRSEFFSSKASIGETFRDEQSSLDAQLSYYVTDRLTLRAEALNLTNETVSNTFKLDGGGTMQLGEWENGRRFFLGANYKF